MVLNRRSLYKCACYCYDCCTTVCTGKFSGHISNCTAIRELFQGEVESIVNSLMGKNIHNASPFEKNNLSGQVAFRFPELNNAELSDSNRDEVAAGVGKTAYLRKHAV